MNDFALSQIFAGISFAFGLASVQFKSRRSILLCLIVSVTFNSVHFCYLGRPEPSALMLLIGLRYLVAVFTTDRKVMFVFLVFNIVTFALTFTSLLSLLTLVGTMLGTYGSFQPVERQVREEAPAAGQEAAILHPRLRAAEPDLSHLCDAGIRRGWRGRRPAVGRRCRGSSRRW